MPSKSEWDKAYNFGNPFRSGGGRFGAKGSKPGAVQRLLKPVAQPGGGSVSTQKPSAKPVAQKQQMEPVRQTPTAPSPAVKQAVVASARAVMKPDEQAALKAGHAAAQAEGYTGTEDDFLHDQLALYGAYIAQGVIPGEQGDPRLKTWFYGETVQAAQAAAAQTTAQAQAAAPVKKTAPTFARIRAGSTPGRQY